ncbi:MAG: GAF domain-containing sensor histidine kinase [Gemmatimonadota bacterium]|nr:MAG: GAF domain-containing sensor histidine kinase [Gemmatimonadota bacterium]
MLQSVVDSAREVIGARYSALGVLAIDGSELETFVASGLPPDQHSMIGDAPTGKGMLGAVIRDPKPLRVRDVSRDPRAYGFPNHHPHMRSFLGVPIVGRTGAIGNLYLADKIGTPEFTSEDESFAVMLAAHAAVAVENARYFAEREGLLKELRSLHHSRERFFAMTNHELRNALTAVHGWTELWIRKTAPDTPRSALEVQESAERALTLLEDLLDLSRLEADKLEPVVKELDVWTVIRESVSTVEPAAERRGIRVRLSGPDGTVFARTDPQRVRQILINLLTNAVRHSPAGDVIQVQLHSDDGTLRFDVVDNGEGIAPEEQAVIFEAFERAGKETERGTGLGLALSRKLARLLGGDLRVESTVGRGARFTLQIPRTVDAPS